MLWHQRTLTQCTLPPLATCGEGPPGLEVEADTDDGGQVDEAEPEAAEHPVSEHEDGGGGREGGEGDGGPGHHRPHHAHRAAPEPVDQPAHQGAGEHVGAAQQAPHLQAGGGDGEGTSLPRTRWRCRSQSTSLGLEGGLRRCRRCLGGHIGWLTPLLWPCLAFGLYGRACVTLSGLNAWLS